MKELKILKHPNPFLRSETKEIKEITKETLAYLEQMKKLLKEANGVGLASIQVGLSEAMFLMEEKKEVLSIINPKIIKYSEETSLMEEGCLSIPTVNAMVKRPISIEVKYQNEKGEEIVRKLEDFSARVFQHEYDHLNGILFIDHLSKLKKQMLTVLWQLRLMVSKYRENTSRYNRKRD